MKTDDINDNCVIECLRNRPEEVFIYSGFGGVLLKKKLLGVEKKFLHAHGGYLPTYKGSTTQYYSILKENKIAASTLFLEEIIDSGPVLMRRKFNVPSNKVELDYFVDPIVRSIVLAETIKEYTRRMQWNAIKINEQNTTTYFIIHPVLKHIAILDKS